MTIQFFLCVLFEFPAETRKTTGMAVRGKRSLLTLFVDEQIKDGPSQAEASSRFDSTAESKNDQDSGEYSSVTEDQDEEVSLSFNFLSSLV